MAILDPISWIGISGESKIPPIAVIMKAKETGIPIKKSKRVAPNKIKTASKALSPCESSFPKKDLQNIQQNPWQPSDCRFNIEMPCRHEILLWNPGPRQGPKRFPSAYYLGLQIRIA